MATCLYDQKELKSKRKDAKFCNDTCGKNYKRKNDIKIYPVIGGQKIPKELEGKLKTPNQVMDEMRVKPYDREANLTAFIAMGVAATNWISTGIPELDKFQQIPRGRVTQIQGPYAVGKTTFALNMLKGLRDKKVLYIDSEASLSPQILVDLELSSDKFTLYNESSFLEDIYDQIVPAASSGKYDIIILDSLAGCTTKTEKAGDATDRNIGQKALIVNKLMRIVPMDLKNSDTALVIINQERVVINSYVPTKYTPGGMGPQYAASLILGLKTIPSWRFPKDAKDGAYKGHEVEVTIIKSKVSQPHRKTKIKLTYFGEEPVKIVDETLVPGQF